MIKLPSYLTGFRSRADKSIGLTFETQELSGEALAELQSLNQSYGWLLFKEGETDDLEVPEDDVPADDNEKKPSERYRAVLYVYWKQQKIKEPFDLFYRRIMESEINKVKEKLI